MSLKERTVARFFFPRSIYLSPSLLFWTDPTESLFVFPAEDSAPALCFGLDFSCSLWLRSSSGLMEDDPRWLLSLEEV